MDIRGSNILVADDEIQFLELASLWLTGEGCSVKTAFNGESAQKLIRDHEFDVVLLDLHLGDCDGLELIREFKKIRPFCEIIVITGYGTVKDAVFAVKSGAFDFLEKPIALFDKLKLVISRAIEKSHSTKRQRYSDLMMSRAAGEMGGWIKQQLHVLSGFLRADVCWISLPGYSDKDTNFYCFKEKSECRIDLDLCGWSVHLSNQKLQKGTGISGEVYCVDKDDIIPDSPDNRSFSEANLDNGMILPFYNEGLTVAVLGAARLNSDQVWAPNNIHMLQLTGAIILGAMEKEIASQEIKRLSGEVIRIADEERINIGRDLHDGIGQELAGLAFMTQALKNKATECGDLEDEITTVLDGLNRSVGLIRRLSKSLSPVDGQWHGVEDAMRSLIQTNRAIWNTECVFSSKGNLSLIGGTKGYNLYRIVQEAIANAIRHGKASRVEVELAVDSTVGIMTITDNGTGINAKTGVSGEGMGLFTMKARTEALGGKFTVTTEDENSGVKIKCEFPVYHNDKAGAEAGQE